MDTKFEFLKQLDRDLRGAAARDRLAMEEAERREVAGGGPAVPFGPRRGASPAPRRRKTWVMLSAASIALLVLAGAVGFIATGGSPFGSFGLMTGTAEDAPPRAATGPAGEEAPTDPAIGGGPIPAGPPQASPAPTDAQREPDAASGGQRDLSKIVRDGRIGVVVDDDTFTNVRDEITRIAEDNDGFVLSSSTRGRRGTFVLRVPARRFSLTLIALGGLGTVEFRDETADDVTAEFIDLQARQEILFARKRVLLGFLREATTVGETLSLYNKVEDTQLQLERIQGNLRFIQNQVSESTIRVQVREKAVKTEPRPEIDRPSLGQAWERAVQGFLNVVAAVVIGLGYLVPIGVIGVVGWLVWRFTRRRSTE
jgi:hypothetical protein